jgi:hypothetical protein
LGVLLAETQTQQASERERKGQREMEHEDVDTSGAEDTPNNNEAVMRFLFSKLYFDSPERFN